jgi:hypothetical protein
MSQWTMPLPQCESFITTYNMQRTIRGWPNGAIDQYEAQLPYSPAERLHVRKYDTHCVCEIEPTPEADPVYHWKDDVVPAMLSGLLGAGAGALADRRRPERGAVIGGLLGLGSYVALRWISRPSNQCNYNVSM